jgi:hypothetical protein
VTAMAALTADIASRQAATQRTTRVRRGSAELRGVMVASGEASAWVIRAAGRMRRTADHSRGTRLQCLPVIASQGAGPLNEGAGMWRSRKFCCWRRFIGRLMGQVQPGPYDAVAVAGRLGSPVVRPG